MKTEKYVRKPLYADCVQVTEENMQQVAEWCDGEVQSTDDRKNYIHVKVAHPLNPRQRMAFAGDWVLKSNGGFKVYTARAFNGAFTKVKSVDQHADEAIAVTEEPDAQIVQFSSGDH